MLCKKEEIFNRETVVINCSNPTKPLTPSPKPYALIHIPKHLAELAEEPARHILALPKEGMDVLFWKFGLVLYTFHEYEPMSMNDMNIHCSS